MRRSSRSLRNFRLGLRSRLRQFSKSSFALVAPRRYRRALINRRVPEPYRAAFASLRPVHTAIDCGARVGSITEVMAVSGARVFAFEPDPDAFAKLKKLESFSNVTLLNSAVSDHAGRERFYVGGEGSSLFEEHPYWDGSPPLEVDVIDLDVFIAGLDEVHLLKLDIEGTEVVVLRRLLDTGLIQKVRHVFVETHERLLPALAEETVRLRRELEERAPHVRLDWP